MSTAYHARRILAAFLAAVLLAACDNTAQKEEPNAMLEGFSEDAIAAVQTRVDNALQLAAELGHAEVMRRITEEKALWEGGAAYVFVISAGERTTVAHPVFPENVGRPLTEIAASTGNPPESLDSLVNDATEDGAWVEYQWFNPETDELARKVSWVKKTGDYIYGSGMHE